MNCDHVYIGETGRPLGARVKECKKEGENITGVYARPEKTRVASICNNLVIMDNVCNENHATDWDSIKAIDHEADKMGRHIREAIWIRNSNNMNQDEGNYILSHVWEKLLLNNIRHQKSVLMKTSDRPGGRKVNANKVSVLVELY